MTPNLQRLAFSFLAIGLLASPSAAAIVRAKYEGEINRIGASTPAGFSLGQRVWGEFAYNTESVDHGNDFMPQYPAVRQLSVQTENGFFASINTGTIITLPKQNPISLNQPAIIQPFGFRVTSLPPISLGRDLSLPSSDYFNMDSSSPIFFIGPDGEPILVGIVVDYGDLYEFQPEIGWEAWNEGYLEAIELGFPLPSGAFTKSAPFMLSLALGNERLEFPGLPAQPSGLDPTSTSTGQLYFGGWLGQRPEFAVEFNITNLTVVPEPSNLALIALGVLTTMRRSKPSPSEPGRPRPGRGAH